MHLVLICSTEFASPGKAEQIRTLMQFCTRCIFIKHRLHDQNTPQVLIYTPCVNLHWGANWAYKRGTTISFSRIWLAVDFLRPKLCEISIQICDLKNWTHVTFNYFLHDPVFEHSITLLFALLACIIMHINGK